MRYLGRQNVTKLHSLNYDFILLEVEKVVNILTSLEFQNPSLNVLSNSKIVCIYFTSVVPHESVLS